MKKKKHALEVKVSLLLVATVSLVILAGYFAYMSISGIVDSFSGEVTPDYRIINLKEITSDLNEAESSVRLYMVTGKEKDLQPYYAFINQIDERMDLLSRIDEEESRQKPVIDSIRYYLNQKAEVWKGMLLLRADDRVKTTLNQLSERLLVAEEDTVLAEEEEKKNIFRRIFGKKVKEEEPETSIEQERVEKEISELEVQERKISDLIRRRELELIEKNRMITASLNHFIDVIEKMENESLVEKARLAEIQTERTRRRLMLFGISVVILLLMVLLIINSYVRKSNSYQGALLSAKNKAEELARTKEMFLASVSHEMKTPMNAIHGLSEQLVQNPEDRHLKNHLDIIRKSTKHLIRIVNDILDFSRLQAGKIRFESIVFSVREVFQDVYLINESVAKEKGLELVSTIDSSVPEYLEGDPLRLKQIIINLVNNALKFTEKGKVSIEVSLKKGQGDKVKMQFIIADTGIGIPEPMQEKIFDDFVQVKSADSSNFRGTGLGLSIVKQLVERQGGSIQIESEVNQGTRFIIHLPYKTVSENIEKTSLPEGSPGDIQKDYQGKKILVVDDEKYNRLLFRVIFDKWKLSFIEATNGREAIEKLEKEDFDLIFMDIRMPEMDGIETATKMLKIKPELIIFGISASITENERALSRQTGFRAILHKPFTEHELEQLMIKHKLSTEENPEMKINPEVSVPEKDIIDHNDPDLTELYRMSDRNEDFVSEMIEVFERTAESGIRQMYAAFEQNDLKKINLVAHRIASPCIHIKAMILYNILKRIETKGMLMEKEELLNEIKLAESELNRVNDRLNEYKR